MGRDSTGKQMLLLLLTEAPQISDTEYWVICWVNNSRDSYSYPDADWHSKRGVFTETPEGVFVKKEHAESPHAFTFTSCFETGADDYPALTPEEHAALIPVLDDFLLALEYARNPPRGDIDENT